MSLTNYMKKKIEAKLIKQLERHPNRAENAPEINQKIDKLIWQLKQYEKAIN